MRAGCQCVVLSDKGPLEELSPPIPPLLATGAVHHHLIRAGLRTETSIAVETAQCFSTHHVAMLVGYGAHAVCPYLALESCRQWRASPRTEALVKAGKVPDLTAETATINYKKVRGPGWGGRGQSVHMCSLPRRCPWHMPAARQCFAALALSGCAARFSHASCRPPCTHRRPWRRASSRSSPRWASHCCPVTTARRWAPLGGAGQGW